MYNCFNSLCHKVVLNCHIILLYFKGEKLESAKQILCCKCIYCYTHYDAMEENLHLLVGSLYLGCLPLLPQDNTLQHWCCCGCYESNQQHQIPLATGVSLILCFQLFKLSSKLFFSINYILLNNHYIFLNPYYHYLFYKSRTILAPKTQLHLVGIFW